MHLCEQPMNITRRACCQLVLLLNDTTRVPPCHIDFLMAEYNKSRISSYSTPIWLADPPEVREDHVTFFLGMLVLVLLAVGCALTLSRLTKPKVAVGYGSVSSYDFMMWMPSTNTNRRSSMLLLLRGITCRRPRSNYRDSAISVVSSNIGLLPSYQSATSSVPSSAAPPPYAERQPLNALSVA